MTDRRRLDFYDDVPVPELAGRTGAPAVHAFQSVDSTMDVAHSLAREGAGHGTAVVADAQRAGRGRERHEWRSPPGGVWFSVVLRDLEPRQLSILPLRVGIALATALEPFAGTRIGLKWPNDLFLEGRKLAGTLAEARWRGNALDWVVLGVGINLVAPAAVDAAGLGATVSRLAVLEHALPAVLSAARSRGELTSAELTTFTARDIARGRMIAEPVHGIVAGIDRSGALLVEIGGVLTPVRSGSLVFAVQPPSLSANS
jgi:BirA family transcriptional regulator, biotin operon repressor / biotin---[acetyl-CoA-carboxylase] ligase